MGNLAAITRLKANGDIFNGYVICNSRGDVEEIRKSTGELYARYVYDSWGNVIHVYDADGEEIESTSTSNLAIQNPFRYRGYYYDAESGLYYLQSRYYDPETGRFVNADSLVDTSDVLGFNMYAYCGNNPVNYYDPTGFIADLVNDLISFGKDVLNTGYDCVAPALTEEKTFSIKNFLSDVYSNFINSPVLNAGYGCGYGYEFDSDFGSVSARFSVNPVNVQVSNDNIKFYSSIYVERRQGTVLCLDKK